MRRISFTAALALTLTFLSLTGVSGSIFPTLKGLYFGQTEPQSGAHIFAPSIISTGLYERDIAFSPDGTEVFCSLFMGDWNTIMHSKQVNGVWQEPMVAHFARDTNFFFVEPAFSSDGGRVFYMSTKPRENETPMPGWNNQSIWVSNKQPDGSWSQGTPLPQNINAEEEFFPSLTTDGTLYFCRTNKQTGNSQILRSKIQNGEYADPEVLPAPVNTEGTHFNAFISPDESYLIGCVGGRNPQNPRATTYMLFLRDSNGSWSNGIDLIKELNLPCPNAISASVSPDGKYLFFASTVRASSFKHTSPQWTLTQLTNRRNSAGNGNADIYWIRIDTFINKLKSNT